MPKLEPMQPPQRRTGGRRGRMARVSTSLAEINVVPLVDVMLVLLVIFMVATPMMQQGFPVKLPESRQSSAIKAEPVVVTVPRSFARDRQVRLGEEAVALSVLDERVRQALSGRLTRDVVLAADGNVIYQDIVLVFDRLRMAGVSNIGMQTQPATGR